MKKEKLIEAGRAAYGDNWKSSILRDLGLNHRQRITQWLNDERPIPQLEPELIAILETRKSAIDNAISVLKGDFHINEKVDLTASFVVVAEGGHLLDEQFNTIEDAQNWVNETWDEDDQYLATFHEMTIAQQYALETMQHFSDVYEPKKVLEAIKSGQFEKSEQEYYLDLCELDENHLGREYYAYYIANEFNLSNTPSFNLSDDDFDHRKTISYKQFIMKRIAELSKYVAVNF